MAGVNDPLCRKERKGKTMNMNHAMEIIFWGPQYRELMEALEEAKQQLSPEEWQRVSSALINDVEAYVEQRLAELSEGREAGKTFRA
jgi:hypothetical protein